MTTELITTIITALVAIVGGAVHAVYSAFRLGRIVQRVDHLEEAKERDQQLNDRIFATLDVIKEDVAMIKAVMPKRSSDAPYY